MSFEKTKKHLMTVKIVTCIIINFMRLKELHTKIQSTNIINNLLLIKDLSKLTYNLITFNLISFFYTSIPLCMKLRRLFRKKET